MATGAGPLVQGVDQQDGRSGQHGDRRSVTGGGELRERAREEVVAGRAGGRATVRTSVGGGTEVRLEGRR